MSNEFHTSLCSAILVINHLLYEEKFIFKALGPKGNHTTRIVISAHGAGSELIAIDGKINATNIPALNVYEWNDDNLDYLKSWLASVFLDENVKNSENIEVFALNWIAKKSS